MSNSIGNLKNSGLQGNNFPWQLKVLQGLQAIYDATNSPLTCVDQVTVCGTSFNNSSGNSSLNVHITNPIPLEVNINEANDSILIYGFDGTTNRKIKTDAAGSVSINDGGNSITVDGTVSLSAGTLSALENITVQNGPGVNAVNIQDGGNSITVDGGTGVARTPNFLRPTGVSGTVAAGTFSMSFASVGTANATVGGITLKPGETLNFDAGAINNTLGAVAYSTTTAGAELIIITLT